VIPLFNPLRKDRLSLNEDLLKLLSEFAMTTTTAIGDSVEGDTSSERTVISANARSSCYGEPLFCEDVSAFLSASIDRFLAKVPEPVPTAVACFYQSSSVDDLARDVLDHLKNLHRIVHGLDLSLALFKDRQGNAEKCLGSLAAQALVSYN
jgi:hypothetical protein